MSKATKPYINKLTAGSRNQFGQSRLSAGITASNSNARIVASPQQRIRSQNHTFRTSSDNLGLNSESARSTMVHRLTQNGINNPRVLAAMQSVPRHLFVDQGLASRAYEDAALPIGFNQTISQPWVVARMLSIICEPTIPNKVLEVGAGCGYQAAVLSKLIPNVFAIERIIGLYDQAIKNLNTANLSNHITLVHGDGMLGLHNQAPFDAIIIAAAGLDIPQSLKQQLSIGGKLIAPQGEIKQNLVLIKRISHNKWEQHTLEEVRFVPLIQGVQF